MVVDLPLLWVLLILYLSIIICVLFGIFIWVIIKTFWACRAEELDDDIEMVAMGKCVDLGIPQEMNEATHQ